MRSSSSCSWAASSRARLLASTTRHGLDEDRLARPGAVVDDARHRRARRRLHRQHGPAAALGGERLLQVRPQPHGQLPQQVGRVPPRGGEPPAERGELRRCRVEQPAAGVEGAVQGRLHAPHRAEVRRGEGRGEPRRGLLVGAHGLARLDVDARGGEHLGQGLGVEGRLAGRGGGRRRARRTRPRARPRPGRAGAAPPRCRRRGRPPRDGSAEGASARARARPPAKEVMPASRSRTADNSSSSALRGSIPPGDYGGGPLGPGGVRPRRAAPGIGLGTGVPTEGSCPPSSRRRSTRASSSACSSSCSTCRTWCARRACASRS